MTSETETDSPSAGSNDRDDNDMTITLASDTTSKSSANNRGRGRGRGGHMGRGVHQGRGGWGGLLSLNLSTYTSSAINFKGEVDYFGAVLGTSAKQSESKDQYNKFIKNTYQYNRHEI